VLLLGVVLLGVPVGGVDVVVVVTVSGRTDDPGGGYVITVVVQG
jgi:hypothetical protein